MFLKGGERGEMVEEGEGRGGEEVGWKGGLVQQEREQTKSY